MKASTVQGPFAENMDSKKLLKQAVPFFRLIQGDRLIYGPLYSSFTENRLGYFLIACCKLRNVKQK